MKIIMYHYVREYNSKYPFFRFLDIKNFRNQLDFLENEYGFLKRDEWENYTLGVKSEESKDKVVLTFDDAMICNYQYVIPELKSRGIWALFYIPIKPYKDNEMLDVHKIHLLCGAFDGKLLLNYLRSIISPQMLIDKEIDYFRDSPYSKQNNYVGVSEFKRILNYFVDYKYKKYLIDKVALNFDYIFDPDSFYIKPKNIIDMHNTGNIIGAHTVNHPVMSKLSYEEQLVEIDDSFSFLESINCIAHKTYCHPYGGFKSFNKDTIKILNEKKVRYSFNVESRDASYNDILKNKHYLPRHNCNEFAYGKSS